MCLAIPAELIAIDETAETGTVSVEGVRKEVSLALVEGVAIGDYVLVHVGFALSTISPEEAEKTLALMTEAGIAPAEQEEANA